MGKTAGDKTMVLAPGAATEVEHWPLGRLVPYARNPRRNDQAAERLVPLIREFGFRIPILAKPDGEVIAGHTRLKAAEKLGLETVPVIVVADLSEAKVRAFRIADNKSAEWADWVTDLLAAELSDLRAEDYDLTLAGFDLDEALSLLSPGEDLEEIAAGEGESTSGAKGSYLSFGDEKVPVTEEEIEALRARLATYVETFGSNYGFGGWLARGETSE